MLLRTETGVPQFESIARHALAEWRIYPAFQSAPQACWTRIAGRYKAILVQKETYLLELARYIVLNPVRAHKMDAAVAKSRLVSA